MTRQDQHPPNPHQTPRATVRKTSNRESLRKEREKNAAATVEINQVFGQIADQNREEPL